MIIVDFNKLSEWGLIYEINKEVLHPLGLSLSRNEDGTSNGAFVSNDLEWEYDDEVVKRNEPKIRYFCTNRKKILQGIEEV